jgi:hypothetical protein
MIMAQLPATLPADAQVLIACPPEAEGYNTLARMVADENRHDTWIDLRTQGKYRGDEVTAKFALVLIHNRTDRTGGVSIRKSAEFYNIPCPRLSFSMSDLKRTVEILATRRQKATIPNDTVPTNGSKANGNGHGTHTEPEAPSSAVVEPKKMVPAPPTPTPPPQAPATPPVAAKTAAPVGPVEAKSPGPIPPAAQTDDTATVAAAKDPLVLLEDFMEQTEQVGLAILEVCEESRALREKTARLEQELQQSRSTASALEAVQAENAEQAALIASLQKDNEQLQTTISQLRAQMAQFEAQRVAARQETAAVTTERDQIKAELEALRTTFSGVEQLIGKIKKPV